ncbi:Uncharacterized protein TCM_017285 [Theobroma cacao]|uniref:Uncharacterized protein n=1 Tax=Theobroma cacao TaxID=3641 RepID=A0A061EE12_THECC|nr:Uncharacterized protein TCM_017285 [Theobroma cacao]
MGFGLRRRLLTFTPPFLSMEGGLVVVLVDEGVYSEVAQSGRELSYLSIAFEGGSELIFSFVYSSVSPSKAMSNSFKF